MAQLQAEGTVQKWAQIQPTGIPADMAFQEARTPAEIQGVQRRSSECNMPLFTDPTGLHN
eukprot:CAMPEP_0174364518 /NCGR_PEP_ID=MMETSP0811_2-20130205/73227_1 /TAXON_ID=73025 ORGANISM="Eutreptiella gymnastica-like, Strain CCMP1594" /NCGR_SAMPLE_ID=MMETSP0811_2 /ASSEMBLY_ACC=CAM_ASM_000667 /LENGTH=59 /DNA_ID=CAMNT_0015504225 /DNA_START=161 /DNA_END=338 /DNA_ORIENTATION=+